MDLVINRIKISDFKGIRERTVDLNESFTKIEGPNATGKTTIATAFYWVFCNEDYELKSNPAVFPLNVEEATPTVEIIFTIDGKPLRVCKTQTRKVSKSGDVKKVATTNTYSINDIPVSETDFQKRLTLLGVELEKFEMLSHPNSFMLSEKRDMRNILFGMAKTYTDKDIADIIGPEVEEAGNLLTDYKFEEVKAMQNATLRKITENYGKRGEIINARIEELEKSKVDIDLAEVELHKNALKEKLAENDKQRKQNIETQNNLDILQQKCMDLQFEISGKKNSLSAVKKENLEKLNKEVTERKTDLDMMAKRFNELKSDKDLTTKRLSYAENELRVAEEMYSKTQNMAFDKQSETCPTCGQRLPEADIEKLLDNFNLDKKKKVDKASKDIEEAKTLIEGYKKSLADLEQQIDKCKVEGKAVQDLYQEAIKKYQAYKDIPEDEPTDDLKVKEIELADINKKIEQLKATYIPNLDLTEVNLREQLSEVDKKLAQGENNVRIDERIVWLRDKQREYEQNRANAEKVLYQLDIIQKRKNELLTDEINKNFKLVRWEFFKFQKNGEYAECCNVFCGDKELGSALNTAMQIRAKIDICDSLQRFYNQHLPIWLDGGEALDSKSQELLATDTQMILLAVKG